MACCSGEMSKPPRKVCNLKRMEVCLEKQKCRYCQLIGRFRPLCVFVGVQSQSRGLIALTYLPSFVPVTGSGFLGILQKMVVVFDVFKR